MTSYKMPELPEDYRFVVREDVTYTLTEKSTGISEEVTQEAYDDYYISGDNKFSHDAKLNGLLRVTVESAYHYTGRGAYVQKRVWGFLWDKRVYDPNAATDNVSWSVAVLANTRVEVVKVDVDEKAVYNAAVSLLPEVTAHQEQQRLNAEAEARIARLVGEYPPKELDKLDENK